MRLFISIELPEEARNEIKRIQDLLPEFKGKKTEEQNLHLTLKFLGEVEENGLEEIKNRLREINASKFKTRLGEIGVFSKQLIRIVWIKLQGAEKLQEEIDRKLVSLFPQEERFMGHITLARVKGIKERRAFIDALSGIKAKWTEFYISKFSLKKSILTSSGPVYEDVEVFELE